MQEIGLQFEARQDKVIDAVRRYVSQGRYRLIEECPLRRGLRLFRTQTTGEDAGRPAWAAGPSRSPWPAAHLSALFESYFDYYFQALRRRALVVCPTVGRWTGVLYDERAVDCYLLRAVSEALECRAVGYCFIEDEEYSYIELAAGRVVEVSSSFLADGGGLNFWSTGNDEPPAEGAWIAEGFLKKRYQFIPGFYDRRYLRGEKPDFACYQYSALPDQYDESGNFPLGIFRYFYFHCEPQ